MAGGTPFGANVSEEGVYIPTAYAHHGMRGTELPPMPTGTVWRRGGEATVSWNVRNNHGGGYQYRVCPAEEKPSEECFQRHPLPFMRDRQAILLANGTALPIPGTFVDVGTLPAGSTWAKNPLPRNDFNDTRQGFTPPPAALILRSLVGNVDREIQFKPT